MRKKQIFNYAVKGIIVGTLVLSLGGGIALAASTNTASTSSNKSTAVRGCKDCEAREKMGCHRGKRNAEERKQALSTLLSTLVKDKKISQDTANKVSTFFDKKAEERKSQHEKIKNLPKEERKKYFESHKKQKINPFTEMVEQKILTPAEAKILQDAFPKYKK